MSESVEKQSEREAEQVAYAKGDRGDTQSRLDEYLSGSDGYEETLRIEEQDHKGYARGARVGKVNNSGERRKGSNVQVGSFARRCRLLARKYGEYPCYHCEGGRSFAECRRIRGLENEIQ